MDPVQRACLECTFLNNVTEARCVMCGTRFVQEVEVGDVLKGTENFSELTWECEACSFANELNKLRCVMCSTQAPQWVPDLLRQSESEYKIFSRETERHVYQMQEWLEVEDREFVTPDAPFACPVCLEDIEPDNGIRLRSCLHDVCKECIARAVDVEENGELRCAACNLEIEDRDMIHIVSREAWEKRLLRVARNVESKLSNTVHCLNPDCEGYIELIGGTNFECPVCNVENCLTCETIHQGQSCAEYRAAKNRNANLQKSQSYLEGLVMAGRAMRCPGCGAIVEKDGGCSFLRCGNPTCQMELCWLTKGPRWGPRGRGDISGGCRCGVNGKKCHPECRWCHS